MLQNYRVGLIRAETMSISGRVWMLLQVLWRSVEIARAFRESRNDAGGTSKLFVIAIQQ
jgi:hypothetical protein